MAVTDQSGTELPEGRKTVGRPSGTDRGAAQADRPLWGPAGGQRGRTDPARRGYPPARYPAPPPMATGYTMTIIMMTDPIAGLADSPR